MVEKFLVVFACVSILSVACLCVLVEWICMHLRLFLALCVIMCVFVYVCADCVLLNRCAGSQARAYVCQSGVHQARFGSATVRILLWQFAVPHCICLHKLSLDIVVILAMLWGFVSAACVWKSGSYSMYSIRKHSTRSQETFLKGSHQHDNNTHTQPTHTAAADLSAFHHIPEMLCWTGIWWLWWPYRDFSVMFKKPVWSDPWDVVCYSAVSRGMDTFSNNTQVGCGV